MIVRLWRGWTTAANADAYEELLMRRLRQAVARRRLAAVRAVLVQSTPKVRDLLAQGRVLRPQILNLPLQRGDQIPNLGLENDPYLNLYLPAPRPKKSHPSRTSVKPVANETDPTLAVTIRSIFPSTTLTE